MNSIDHDMHMYEHDDIMSDTSGSKMFVHWIPRWSNLWYI